MELLNTELDAVNLALSGIGREPVASLESTDLDAAMALSVLERVSLDLQMNMGKGWWFNNEKGWKLVPDNQGRITVPNNTLSILEARGSFYDVGNRLTLRGQLVYDTDQHTLDMTNNVGPDGSIEFTLIILLAYKELPPSARAAIAWRARRVFVDDVLGDPNQHRINLVNEKGSMFALEAEDNRVRRHNYLRSNGRVNAQLGLIGGFNNMYR